MLKEKIELNRKRSAIWKIDSLEFKKIIQEKNTFTEVLNHFGLKMHGANNKTLKERIDYEEIDISHILKAREELNKKHLKKIHGKKTKPLKEILVENSPYKKTHHLKLRLLKEKLLEEKCYECGLKPFWNGKKLSLHLEHKNGINDDNRLENLCLLCPNCHSQTDTYSGKSLRKYYQCSSCGENISKGSKLGLGYCNSCIKEHKTAHRKVQDRPSRIELIELILNRPFVQIGKDFGVSDNAVRKWCKSENLPYRKKDIEEMRSELEKEIHSVTN